MTTEGCSRSGLTSLGREFTVDCTTVRGRQQPGTVAAVVPTPQRTRGVGSETVLIRAGGHGCREPYL